MNNPLDFLKIFTGGSIFGSPSRTDEPQTKTKTITLVIGEDGKITLPSGLSFAALPDLVALYGSIQRDLVRPALTKASEEHREQIQEFTVEFQGVLEETRDRLRSKIEGGHLVVSVSDGAYAEIIGTTSERDLRRHLYEECPDPTCLLTLAAKRYFAEKSAKEAQARIDAEALKAQQAEPEPVAEELAPVLDPVAEEELEVVVA